MRNDGIAYLLWLLIFVGVAGVHRMYAGKWITGLIWFFTGGLLLIGQIVDLFLIPGMIRDANAKHIHEVARQERIARGHAR